MTILTLLEAVVLILGVAVGIGATGVLGLLGLTRLERAVVAVCPPPVRQLPPNPRPPKHR
jgi:hypothetical protein